jgi:hypothetical protein
VEETGPCDETEKSGHVDPGRVLRHPGGNDRHVRLDPGQEKGNGVICNVCEKAREQGMRADETPSQKQTKQQGGAKLPRISMDQGKEDGGSDDRFSRAVAGDECMQNQTAKKKLLRDR